MTPPGPERLAARAPRWLLPGFGARLGTALLAVITLLHLLVQLPAVSIPPAGSTGRDLEVYHTAAREALARRSPYVPTETRYLHRSPETYVYPPPFAAAIAPFGALSRAAFFRVWFALLEISLWILCLALARIAGDRRPWAGALLVGPLAFSALLLVSFGFGQTDLFVFTACALGLLAAVRSRPALAGAAVAAAAAVKIYPVLLLVPLARRFGWRPLAAAAAVLAVTVALSAAWLSLDTYRDFVRFALPVVSAGNLHEENTAPASLLCRLLVAAGWVDPALPTPAWLRLAVTLIGAGMAALAVALPWRRRFPLDVGWAAALCIFAGAICWTSYWTMWLVLAATLWRASATAEGPIRPSFVLLAGGVLLLSRLIESAWDTLAPLLAHSPPGHPPVLWLKGPLTAVLLVAAVQVGSRRPGPRPGAVDVPAHPPDTTPGERMEAQDG